MTPHSPERWNLAAWFRSWLSSDCPDPANQLPLRSWRRWINYDHTIWLVFLGFWCIEPYMEHASRGRWLGLILAVVLFVPSFMFACSGPRRFRWVGVLAMFVIGVAYTPFNESAWGAFIYVAVSIPGLTESTNTVINLFLLQCGVIAIESWLLHFSAWVWSLSLSMPLLFGMNRLRMKQKWRADATLRVAQEEIERLAKTAERERIARDMHDILGHSLSLIVLKSELAGRLLGSQPARAAIEIAEVETAARKALAEVRKTITGYRSEGFASELIRAAEILETAGVRLNRPAKAPYLTPRHEATLSLVLREAVTNIVRHAGASECSIEVSTAEDRTQLVIADDGRGDIRQEGNGLRGMRERVRELGGSLSLDSNRGTRLQIELPQFNGNAEVNQL
jgi:two-component system, NarL family, sensor histidine kinase DesK